MEPATLFDLPLTDEAALRVEAERLRAVIERADREVWDGGVLVEPASEGPPPAASGDGGAEASVPLRELDPELFAARVEVDRARLEFYLLPAARKKALATRHAERQREAPDDVSAELSESQRKAQKAERDQKSALAAAQRARTEAERLVAEERARLLGISGSQANSEGELVKAKQALKDRAERTLTFRRRVRELVADRTAVEGADALYDELRVYLRAARTELDAAIVANTAESGIDDSGPDRLGDLAADVDRSAIEASRKEIDEVAARLRETEAGLRRERAAQLYDDVRDLNADRLTLLPRLSPAKRSMVTGFGAGGFDQAGAELKQVTLVLRYHVMATRRWITGMAEPGSGRGASAVIIGAVAVKWLFALIAFVWWRRRGGPLIEQWRERILEEHRRERIVEPSRLYGALGFVQSTRGPVEWLLLVGALDWLLPSTAQGQLEVTLLTTVFLWTVGGALVVVVINTLAGGTELAGANRAPTQTAVVRLRSLRLIGRTVVGFGLILALSAKLVGPGTIYSWVFSLCWFAAIPLTLVVVRWWRSIIFARINATRKKKAFETWVVANQTGWKSFLAAGAAGAFLFGNGTYRAVRGWVGRFDLTRRALAYLFRRGLDRLAEEKTDLAFKDLPSEAFVALGPTTASNENVSGSASEQVKNVIERIEQVGGGVFAVVGERGGGKTSVLSQVREAYPDVVLVNCPETGLEGLRAALAKAVGADPAASFEDVLRPLNVENRDAAVLIDDAHLLIQPIMGGLAEFDRLIDVARHNSSSCAWFFAIDDVIWRFFERARGARPLFDEVIALDPWREEEIVKLLTARCEQAGVAPSFEHLLESLPADADEVDRTEALSRAAAGYYRLLWDYSAGNPGVALHMWRRSLGLGAEDKVCVKLFQAPDTRELEQLPDPTVFVLRAVIQLEPARPEDVARATMLRGSQVEDALRYGLARGYFAMAGDRYRVSWAWYRAVTRFLQRRHLLASRR